MQSDKPIASLIDHTLLKPEATQDQIAPSRDYQPCPWLL